MARATITTLSPFWAINMVGNFEALVGEAGVVSSSFSQVLQMSDAGQCAIIVRRIFNHCN
jgi:hypothetical protein